jgi:SAM-dependent methyltransferase
VLHGVPVLLPSAFPRDFVARHKSAIDRLAQTVNLRIDVATTDDFSFSAEWAAYFEQAEGRMWGWTVAERVEQLMLELQVERQWFRGKSIFDAGCGPGDFTDAIASLGANVVGLDYSSAVFEAERRRQNRTLQLIRGDVAATGLPDETFDAVVSMGVIMFTPDPRRSFAEICRLVKPGGRFYICLDKPSETFAGRYLRHAYMELGRRIVSRLPPRPQELAVMAWARLVYGLHRGLRGKVAAPFGEYLVTAYNDLTPRWRRYHTAYQIAGWFHDAGFSAPTLSHWDNPHAFGLVAIKQRQPATPGVHFGSSTKLWDDRQSLVR